MADPLNLPAVTVTVWGGDDLAAALDAARPALARIRPQGVMLHTRPSAHATATPAAADAVRALLPGCALWLGVAADAGWTAHRDGKLTAPELHRRRRAVAALAARLGAQGVCWNAEGAWKRGLTAFSEAAARQLVADVARDHPALVQAHSAYDQPHLHGSYPWAGWKGCAVFQPQIYFAPKTGTAPTGAGARRLAAHRKSWAAAVKAGKLPAGPIAPYLQIHGGTARDIVGVADTFDAVVLWAAPTRCDDEGIRAAMALAELGRRGFRGPGRVAAFQRAVGLAPDGIAGPKTLGALLGPG